MARTVSSTRAAEGAQRPAGLAPAELLGALRACATVLDQHADALDRLDADVDWMPDHDAAEDPLLSAPVGSGGSLPDGAASEPGAGTDLAATLSAGCNAADGSSDLSSIGRGLAAGAASAARTVAGRRLAGFLDGMADVLRNADRVDGGRLALALEAGAERVTESDDGAHPGCLLSVMSAAADGALAASDGGGDLSEVLVSGAEAGLIELELGPSADARLAERGTVDAAAAGFLLVLDSLAAVVAGDPLPEPPRVQSAEPLRPGSGERFVVRCLLAPPTNDIEAAADLEVVVHELSDRLAFEGAGTRWTVDAVTAFPGAVVEALAGAGTLTELHIGLAESATLVEPSV